MDQDLKLLQEVQEWDKDIYSFMELLEAIPKNLAEVTREVETERAILKKFQDELKVIQLKQKEKEGLLSTKEENIKKLDGQLGQVKTNKEYSSLQAEINSLKADNSILEEEIIRLFDQVEEVQKRVESQKKKVEASEQHLKEKQKELDEKADELRQRIQTLKDQKKEKIKQVNPEFASLYEQIVTKKHGLALVKVDGEVCPACQMQLRPQVVNEIKLKETIIICDNCSRILYSD